ncbi:MAG: hypothetical protein OEL89_01620 [Candidatus Peregrinibacteria bacterium]|nr:hypothetical protein [Candidatus Peregrinibacteria bacterium]
MSITFANDLLLYFDRLTIKYSTDGTTLSTWTTGQATVAGLFRLNTATRLFEVGYDGTVYKAMYVDSIFVECNNSVTYIPILDFTLSSGSTIEDNSRAVNENELTGLFPLNLIRDNILDIDLSF